MITELGLGGGGGGDFGLLTTNTCDLVVKREGFLHQSLPSWSCVIVGGSESYTSGKGYEGKSTNTLGVGRKSLGHYSLAVTAWRQLQDSDQKMLFVSDKLHTCRPSASPGEHYQYMVKVGELAHDQITLSARFLCMQSAEREREREREREVQLFIDQVSYDSQNTTSFIWSEVTTLKSHPSITDSHTAHTLPPTHTHTCTYIIISQTCTPHTPLIHPPHTTHHTHMHTHLKSTWQAPSLSPGIKIRTTRQW